MLFCAEVSLTSVIIDICGWLLVFVHILIEESNVPSQNARKHARSAYELSCKGDLLPPMPCGKILLLISEIYAQQ